MMAFRLPKVNTQGTIGPTQMAATTVPTGPDPLLAVEKANAENLSSRMNQMSAAAFKIANKQAETRGTAYGALNAPTAEQVRIAAQTGKPITLADLPGDPSSISIAEQAASAGAVAVIEDRLEMAGRKALTEVTLTAAADPDTTPAQFGAAIDDVVQSYTETMAGISQTSAAKISASLAMVANSQAVSFTRNYSTAQKKRVKDEALANVNAVISSFPTIISGHIPPGDDNPEGATLEQKLDLTRLRSMLENAGHNETKIKTTMTRAQKVISEAKVASMSEWAHGDNFTNNPTGALRAMAAGKMPDHLKSIWKSMSDTEKADARKAISEAAAAQNRAIEIEIQRSEHEDKLLIRRVTRSFNEAYVAQDDEAMQTSIDEIEPVDPDEALRMKRMMQSKVGAIEDNQEDLKELRELRARRRLTLKAIEDARLKTETRAKMINELRSQLDDKMEDAETIAKSRLQPPAATLSRSQLTTAEQIARAKFTKLVGDLTLARIAAEARGEPFDPLSVIDDLIGKVNNDERLEKRTRQQSIVDRGLAILPEHQRNEEGLRRALTLKTDSFFSSPVYKGQERDTITRAIRALEAIKELDKQ